MRYNVDFEINGMIEVTAESEDEAVDIVEDIVEDMNLHELLEDADGVQVDAYANEMDEEEMQ